MHERSIEFLIQKEGIFLRHVGGKNKRQASIGYSALDWMDSDNLSSDDEVEPFPHVADGFFLQGHGAPTVE